MIAATSQRTLTFLFTDIEGSTPLWDTRPAAMGAATDRHNALLREAITRHGGHAFRVVGDAFCIAFSDATSAVLAAIDAQRALCAQRWDDAPIHVRMGLHSGAVEDADDEIFRGPTLARAAPVMSAAHGGWSPSSGPAAPERPDCRSRPRASSSQTFLTEYGSSNSRRWPTRR